ncbi:hypothetical protein DG37_14540 [Listeria monocytogenes]|nr:hypothetical protein [Listeria monocytogenes]
MESDILGVFQCGTSQERKGKSALFNGKKSTSLKNEHWHAPKNQKTVIKCMEIICKANYLDQKQVQEQECLAISDYFIRCSLI